MIYSLKECPVQRGSWHLIRRSQLREKLGIEVSTEQREVEGWPCSQRWGCGCQESFAGRYFWELYLEGPPRVSQIGCPSASLSNLAFTLWIEHLSPSLESRRWATVNLGTEKAELMPLLFSCQTSWAHTPHGLALQSLPPSLFCFASWLASFVSSQGNWRRSMTEVLFCSFSAGRYPLSEATLIFFLHR